MSQSHNAASEAAFSWLVDRFVRAPGEHAEFWRRRSSAYAALVDAPAEQQAERFERAAKGFTVEPTETLDHIPVGNCSVMQQAADGSPLIAEIELHGEIGAFGSLDAILRTASQARHLSMHVDSTGGCGHQAMRAFRVLSGKLSTARIKRAFSAACLLVQSAGQRIMEPDGSLMLHRVTAFIAGGPCDLRVAAQTLERETEEWAAILVARTGQTRGTVHGWLTGDDEYFAPKEALRWGLVDSIREAA